MRPRHKVPSVFNLSMVDVLCCALGCVILIWLLNAKLSDDRATKERRRSQGELAAAIRDARDTDKRYQLILVDRDKADALARLLKEKIDGLETMKKGMELDLQRTNLEVLDLTGKLKTTDKKAAEFEGDLLALRKKYDAEQLRLVALDKRLVDLLAKLKTTEDDLEKSTDKVEKSREAMELKAKDLLALQRLLEDARLARKLLDDQLGKKDAELLLSKEKRVDLEKLLALRKEAADRTIEALEKDKVMLRLTAEARFAGIELTGRRVIFLIDMSGSMKYTSEKTEAPNKWREVRETLARLMRSMSGMEKFQVITFSANPAYPLGGRGKWLDFDKTRSPDAAVEALTAIDPAGGTNMYEALQEAFQFRADELDTIFVLSDGLPNTGPGALRAAEAKMTEMERGLLLGKYVLRTMKEDWNVRKDGRRVKVHTVGFFYESPDLGSFLWARRDNEGSFVGMSRP